MPRPCHRAQANTEQEEGRTELEECILAAASEDEVQACLAAEDERAIPHPPAKLATASSAKGPAEPLTEVEECILAAASEDEVQACVAAEDAREAAAASGRSVRYVWSKVA